MCRGLVVISGLVTDRLDGLLVEPVGASGPKFPTVDTGRSFRTREGEALTLLCPAQAFPVPMYR